MPAQIKKNNGKYTAYTPNGVKGKGMTFDNARKQQRLLNAIHYTSWRPTKRKGGLLKHKRRR
jgi:hypothetical protein